MFFIIKQVISFMLVICFFEHSLFGSTSSSGLNPNAHPDNFTAKFPERSGDYPSYIGHFKNFLASTSEGQQFIQEVLKGNINDMPANLLSFKKANTVDVYRNWYASRHGSSTVSTAKIQELEEAKQEVEERLQQEAQQKAVLQEKLSTTEKEKSAMEQQLVEVGQNLEVAQLGNIVARGIPQDVAVTVHKLLTLEDKESHDFVFDDATHTVILNVKLKDGGVINQNFSFASAQYDLVVDGFKAMARQYELLQSVFGGPQRQQYKIILTDRPAKQDGEPPALSSLMDSYYYTLEAASQIVTRAEEMEQDALIIAKEIMRDLNLANTEQDAIGIITLPNYQKILERRGIDLQKLKSTFKTQKKDFGDTLLSATEDFYTQMVAAKDFSTDVNSLLLSTIQKYDECLQNLKSMTALFSPVYFNSYIAALGKDKKEAEKLIAQEEADFVESCRNSPEVRAELTSMQSQAQVVLGGLIAKIQSLVISLSADREKDISRALLQNDKKPLLEMPCCFAFMLDPMYLFLALNDSKQLMKDFFAGKSNAADNDSRFYIFTMDLAKLTNLQKKALLLSIINISENFEALEKTYADITCEVNKVKLSEVKAFKEVLKKSINKKQLDTQVENLKLTKYNSTYITALIRIYEMINQNLGDLARKCRVEKLVSLLDIKNSYISPLKQFENKASFDGMLADPLKEEILKRCWDYLQDQRTAEVRVHNDAKQIIDQEIKDLQEVKIIVEKFGDKIRQASSFSASLVSPVKSLQVSNSSSAQNSTPPTSSKVKVLFPSPQLNLGGGGGIAHSPMASISSKIPSISNQQQLIKELREDIQFIKQTIDAYAQNKGFAHSNILTISPFNRYYSSILSLENDITNISTSYDAQSLNTLRLKKKITTPIRVILEAPDQFARDLLVEIPNVKIELDKYSTDANYATFSADLNQAKQILEGLCNRGTAITIEDVPQIDAAYQKLKDVKTWLQM